MNDKTMSNELQEFAEMFSQFEKLPQPKPTAPTYFEIAGFPHYENVCSNTLAFFCDTQAPHGLGSLMVLALLAVHHQDLIEHDLQAIRVERETETNSRKRIDLIIETEELFILIENKLGATLYNDLDDYSGYAQKTANGKRIIKIVLSLKTENDCHAGFKNITYEQFFKEVKARIGHHILGAQNRYIVLLVDFIKSIENLQPASNMDQNVRQFFIENKEIIERFTAAKKAVDDDVNRKLRQLMGMTLDQQTKGVSKFIWSKSVLIHEYFFADRTHLKVDVCADPEAFYIHVFVQKWGSDPKVKAYIDSLPLFRDGTDNVWLNTKEEMPYTMALEEVAAHVNGYLETAFGGLP